MRSRAAEAVLRLNRSAGPQGLCEMFLRRGAIGQNSEDRPHRRVSCSRAAARSRPAMLWPDPQSQLRHDRHMGEQGSGSRSAHASNTEIAAKPAIDESRTGHAAQSWFVRGAASFTRWVEGSSHAPNLCRCRETFRKSEAKRRSFRRRLRFARMLRQAVVHRGRQDIHHEDRHLVAWTERTGHLSFHRRQTLEIGSDREGVRSCHLRVGCIWHHRSKHSAVRPHAGRESVYDLLSRPRPKTCFLVRREIATDKDATPRDSETDVGAAQEMGHIGFPEQMTGCMAIGAATQRDKVLAAGDKRILSSRSTYDKRSNCQAGDRRQKEFSDLVAFLRYPRRVPHLSFSSITSNDCSVRTELLRVLQEWDTCAATA